MHPNDAVTFKSRIAEVADALDRRPPTDGALKVWFDVLRDHPYSRVHSALTHWTRTSGKFPTPADIEKVCNEWVSKEIEERSAQQKAQERSEFMQTMRSKSPEAQRFRAEIRKLLGAK